MTQTLLELHEKHGVLNCEKRFVPMVAAVAADQWRVMAKHIFQAVKYGKPDARRETLELMGLIAPPKLWITSRNWWACTDGGRSAAQSEENKLRRCFADITDDATSTEGDSEEDQICKCDSCCPKVLMDRGASSSEELQRVHCALAGGQKGETKDASKVKGKGKAKGKRTEKGKKNAGDEWKPKMGKVMAIKTAINYPIRMRLRKVKNVSHIRGHMYDAYGNHVITIPLTMCSTSMFPKYERTLETIVDALNNSGMKTKADAKAFVVERLLEELPRLA